MLKDLTKPLGYQQITSLVAPVSLTVPGSATGTMPARIAVIQCEAQPVRWRDDGVVPNSTTGMRLLVGDELRYDGDLKNIRFIEETAGAILNISYYA